MTPTNAKLTPELKELPGNLQYAFLNNDKSFPVIVSAKLNKLIMVLSQHKSAIGWSIDNIKGISPALWMYIILLEPVAKPKVQPQRRLNLIIQEVVRKEVLKFLDVGMIYAISVGEWMSPTQVV